MMMAVMTVIMMLLSACEKFVHGQIFSHRTMVSIIYISSSFATKTCSTITITDLR